MKQGLRGMLVPALVMTACIAIATMLAVPEEKREEPLSPEEIARIEAFVERFQQGQRLMGSGRDEDAETVFRALIEEEPEAAAVHHALGLLLQFRGFADEASASLLRAAELAPEDSAIQRDAGMDLLKRGFPADAEPYLARARKLWPEDVEVLITHATALRALGRRHDARAAYRAAIELQPNSVDARVGLGAEIVDQQPAKAIELVAELPHNYIDVSLVHGLALVRLKRHEEAVPHLVRATDRPPRTPGAKAILVQGARTLADIGSAKEAAAAAALWCASDGGQPGLEQSLLLATSLSALGKYEDALTVLGQARTEDADALAARRAPLVLGAILLRLDRAEDARKALAELADAKDASPERAVAQRSLGRISDAELAEELGKKAVWRNDAAWSAALAASLAGEQDAASAHMARARELSEPAGEFPALLAR